MNNERALGSVFSDQSTPVRIHDEISDDVMTPQEERELVQKSIDGCNDSFGRLYDHHKIRVHKHIYYMVGNKQTAEDLANTTFMKAYEAIGRYKITGAPFRSWLLRIAHNQGISHLRTKRDAAEMHPGIIDTNPQIDAPANMETKEDMEKLRIAMLKLKPNHQAAVSMKYFEGMEYPEIAIIQGKSVAAVRVDVFRGLRKLRKIIGDINSIDIKDQSVA